MPTVVHLLGPTGAGKSTIIQRAVATHPKIVGAVEVGRMLRAKYPASHFKGNAAPAHTQAEAWDMYEAGVKDSLAAGKSIIFVDGQPRDVQQAVGICGMRWPRFAQNAFILVHADHDIRERRLRTSRTGDSLELAVQRLVNDYRNCYNVFAELTRNDQVITLIDTGPAAFDLDHAIDEILGRYV